MKKTIVHINHPDGHRKSYLDLFVSITGFTPLIGPVYRQSLIVFLRAEKVLFATVGVAFRRFFLVSFLRSLLGKPTCALFLGAMEYCSANTSSVSAMDRLLLKVWKLLPKQTTLAIIPYSVEPTLSQVTTNYIYDPQMWDIWLGNAPKVFPKTPLSDLVEKKRQGRKVLIYIGKGSKLKSFGELVKFAKANSEKIYVIAAGKVTVECTADANKLRSLNMIVENRFTSDEELLSLYGVADFAWCFYSPEYNQASGIFGRAIQLGVKPIVRSGSIIAEISEKFGIPCIKLETKNFNYAIVTKEGLLNPMGFSLSPVKRQHLFTRLRDESLYKLKKSLSLD